MLRFKTMRQRVDFAYEQMYIDIYYEGDFHYTLKHNGLDRLYEWIDEDDLDSVLSQIWEEIGPWPVVGV